MGGALNLERVKSKRLGGDGLNRLWTRGFRWISRRCPRARERAGWRARSGMP